MITHSSMPASIASSAAPLVNAGGTKTTDTSAPVFSIASATVPKTGTSVPSTSTDVPAFFGFTPPTILVPEASMRLVCFMPSEPVMPWTMTLEFSVRKIAILSPFSARVGQFGRAVRGAVHGVDLLHARQLRVHQDLAAQLGVVAVQAHDQRLGAGRRAQQLEGLHDAVGDRVAGGDAAEDVDEHRLHGRVVEDDVQAV